MPFGTPPPSAHGLLPQGSGAPFQELRLFPLETAAHKMTDLSAQRYGLKGRGELKKGAFADIFVNGSLVLWDGCSGATLGPAGCRAGRESTDA